MNIDSEIENHKFVYFSLIQEVTSSHIDYATLVQLVIWPDNIHRQRVTKMKQSEMVRNMFFVGPNMVACEN